MDKKEKHMKKIIIWRNLIMAVFMLMSLSSFAQKKYTYQPMTKSEQNDISNSMFVNDISSFLVNDRLPLWPIDLTNFMNIVSYNPIEGTRIRLSAQTNKQFSKRLALSALAAYGTKDNKFKYAVGAAYNFAHKAKGVYAFPCSTLSLNYEDNTYMPSYSNYDVAYFSFGDWDRFYFGQRRRLSLSFLQEFPNTFAIRPYAYYQQITSLVLYDNGDIIEQLDPNYDYTNKAAGIELSYTPTRKIKNVLNVLNSRFYSFATQIRLNYSYNVQDYKQKNEFSRIELSAQHRFLISRMALDLKVMGGKIFNESDEYMYFTPNYRVSSVSNMFGFNLYSPYEIMCKEYIQTYTQIGLGGLLLDNIPYIKNFRPNEFVNFKALFTKDYDPYYELGVGIDHIFGVLGLEFIKRISNDNPFDMPDYAVKIRCTL